MNASNRLPLGAGLMIVGTLGIFAPLAIDEVPLVVLAVAVLLLAAGTLLVGVSATEAEEQPV